MKRLILILLLPVVFLGAEVAGPSSRFVSVDVFVESRGGQAVAAWQVEFAAEVGNVSLVGVEGGDSPAYAVRPPYYDPAALAGGRIILANYSLAADLPKGKFRAARLMLEIRGEVKPQYVAKVITAADGEGKTISAGVSLVEK